MVTRIDENVREMIDEYKQRYLIEGFNIIISLMKLLFVTIFISTKIFLEVSHPFRIRISYVNPVLITIAVIFHEAQKHYKKWRENVFVLLVASFGFLWINRNIGQVHYTINEFWFVVLSLSSFAAIFMGLDWKKDGCSSVGFIYLFSCSDDTNIRRDFFYFVLDCNYFDVNIHNRMFNDC